jgi:hypothetical protein
MGKWRNQESNHIISKLLKKKGFTSFEYGGSQYKNHFSGWWVESDVHPEINGLFLGCTLKDSVYNLKNNTLDWVAF